MLDIPTAMAWAKQRLDDTRALEVTVVAGVESVEQVRAIPITRSFDDVVSDEFAVKAQTFDWLLEAEDLTFPLAGQQEPAEGWEIRYVRPEDNRTEVYEVRPETGNRLFEFGDPQRLTYIVHTKLARVEL